MPGHKIARKALVEGRIIILAGVILVCLIALVRVIGMLTGGIEGNRQGQAEVVANMIAVSANTLSGMDAGRVTRDFTLSQGSQPMTVEIHDKGSGAMYVKVTYDDKGGFYETPLLVSMAAVAPFRANSISVSKDITGNIAVNGAIGGGWEMSTLNSDVPCSQPTKEKILEYVNNAVSDPNVNRYGADAALVKAVISAESSGLQCVNGRLNVNAKGATGLMQLMPRTAADLNKNFQPPLEPALAQDNIKLGTAYLSYLLRLFNGDRNKAIASYNCGPGNIAKLASYGSDWMPHIDEVCKKETRPYVAKVNACMAACSLKECGIC